jgi:hypothetical protein
MYYQSVYHFGSTSFHTMLFHKSVGYFIAKEYTLVFMYYNLFIPLTDGHLSCFHFSDIVSKTTMNICRKIFMWAYTFDSHD